MWVGERVYFTSDVSGCGNVYSILATKPEASAPKEAIAEELIQHTFHDDYYARNLASDGMFSTPAIALSVPSTRMFLYC